MNKSQELRNIEQNKSHGICQAPRWTHIRIHYLALGTRLIRRRFYTVRFSRESSARFYANNEQTNGHNVAT